MRTFHIDVPHMPDKSIQDLIGQYIVIPILQVDIVGLQAVTAANTLPEIFVDDNFIHRPVCVTIDPL